MTEKNGGNTTFVRRFEQLSKNDVDIAGGKGASLGEMTQAGILVPPGYVVLTDAFERFLDETDLRQIIRAELAKVDQDAVHTVARASEQIQNLIKKEELPEDIKTIVFEAFSELDEKYVAVRSSATSEDSAENAWAGQLDSFLNTTKDTLLENVKNCWASLFTPRAIFYRIEKGLKQSHVSVAVVVQKMVESESSGIAFSVHPVTEDPNQIIIEAGLGLGEAIVSGSITPDSYVIEKEPRKIIDINVAEQARGLYRKANTGGSEWRDMPSEQGSKQVLTEKQILELSELILKIEQHYGFPCDIEWAYENEIFYIVQSRPITTLGNLNISQASTINLGNIKKLNWFKSWEAKFPLFLVSIGAPGYFKTLKEIFGFDLGHFLVTTQEGILAGFWVEEELLAFGTHLTKLAEKNPQTLNTWSNRLVEETDRCRNLLSKGKEYFLNKEHFLELRRADEVLSAYQIACREVINYLPDELREQYTLVLEKARKHSETIFFELSDVVTSILEHVAQQENTPVHVVGCMTGDELELYFEKGTLPNSSILQDRYVCSGFINQPEFVWLSGTEVKQIEASFLEKGSGEVKGTTAYRGKVSGYVRVVKDFSKSSPFADGEVLVTGMTDPNFVPLMEKAAAIVTDAGGLLCHAAIVAREMHKPCIIGTKIATQVLKDGDFVEVDADNGVVRIINMQ